LRRRVENRYYFGPGHTDGDIVVVFPQFSVAFLGDLFPDKAVPAIDVANGGSAVAFADTLAKAAAAIRQMTPAISVLAPGKGAVPEHMILSWLTLKDLDEYVEFNRAILLAVTDAIARGKTASEAAASLRLPDKFHAYGMEHAPDTVKAIYRELKKQ
jgi:glyoxylase-like metal-dependent hydrolase (beta-lactamase superfamily II)